MNGLDILREVRDGASPPAIVTVSANASISTAVQVVRGAAFDHLVKPCAPERLTSTVTNAMADTALRREVGTQRRASEAAPGQRGSAAIRRLHDRHAHGCMAGFWPGPQRHRSCH